MADICAPSWVGYSTRVEAFLNAWLARGFAIAATDYQGLGTPGPHPYMAVRPGAYGVLIGSTDRVMAEHYSEFGRPDRATPRRS